MEGLFLRRPGAYYPITRAHYRGIDPETPPATSHPPRRPATCVGRNRMVIGGAGGTGGIAFAASPAAPPDITEPWRAG